MRIIFGLVVLGILFLGFAIQKLKWYWLIAGYNTMSKEEKENVEIEKVAKEMAIFLYIMAGLILVMAVFGTKYPFLEYILPVAIVVGVFFLILRSGKYDKNKRDKSEVIGTLVILIIPIAIMTFVFATSLSPVKISFENDNLNIAGNVIKEENIESVKLLDKYPTMKKKIGSALGGHRNGTFYVDGFGECKVYTDNLKLPIMEVKANGITYLVNSKDSKLIDEIYEKIKK